MSWFNACRFFLDVPILAGLRHQVNPDFHPDFHTQLLYELLSSRPALEFLRSLVFVDSKRPVTIDVLRRISFFELAKELEKQHELESYVHAARVHGEPERQVSLLMEPEQKYRIKQSDQRATPLG